MKYILWSVFEIIINIFQGFATCYYTYKYMNNNGKFKNFLQSRSLIFVVLMSVSITVVNYITIFEHFGLLIYVMILFIYAMKELHGKLIEKIFSAVLPILIIIISSAFISNFYASLFRIKLDVILSQNNFPRFIALISTQFVMVYLLMISLKILKKKENNSLNIRECMLIGIILLISIAVSTFLNIISFRNPTLIGHDLIVLAFLGLLIINITVFYLVVDLSKINITVRENEALKIKNEYSQQYISSANTQFDVIKKLRHDFKDNMSLIYELIQKGNSNKAISYMNKYFKELSSTENFIKTNNEIVNAVVNSKLSVAKSYGINIICMCISDFNGINDMDLCSLLSNLLENAITACKSCDKDSKRIYINISSDKYRYVFSVKNTIQNSVLQSNPNLITTKDNKVEHGLGVKIIKGIALKYNGKVDFYEENDEFCCNVILKRKK